MHIQMLACLGRGGESDILEESWHAVSMSFFRRVQGVLVLAWLFLAALYGVFAFQGPLPLLSPDETAVFTLAHSGITDGRFGIQDARTAEFLWAHPRSFTTQDGWLIPVGFPLWPVLLSLVGWIRTGGLILWASVLLSASSIIPLVLIAQRCWSWSRARALLWAGSILLFPVAILYGARSGFTLMPQLALGAWSAWFLLRGTANRLTASAVGVLCAVTLGLRPTEVVWLLPVLLVCWYQGRALWHGRTRGLLLGAGIGMAAVAGVHWWVYGAPWAIGYLLPPSALKTASSLAAASAPASWRRFFPYGFSLSQLRQNLQASFELGLWAWMSIWVASVIGWLFSRRSSWKTPSSVALAFLFWTTGWLLLYYGQGRYADHIGGQAMHLGSSFLRYLAPALLGWMGWTAWHLLSRPGRRAAFFSMLLLVISMVAGVAWAYMDPEDGLLRGRRERTQYAIVRADVLAMTDTRTVWISDRSDKMLFPERLSVSPLPSKDAIREFLQAGEGSVLLYARPPRQQERDLWSQAGLELLERAHYERENIYEVRQRPDFAESATRQAH